MNTHGHHKISAAIFVGLLIVGCALILAAELVKPARYEYNQLNDPANYMIFDRDTGRATVAPVDSKTPLVGLEK